MSRRHVLLAALGVLVLVLVFGSVRTTGALWADQAEVAGAEITTGTIGLAPGTADGSSFKFPGLGSESIAPGQTEQAELTIVNTGDTPLEFQLSSAGPNSISGPPVTVELSGSVGQCPALVPPPNPPLSGAFPAKSVSAPSEDFTTVPPTLHVLDIGESVVWCIRVTLESVSSTGSATFTITFGFDAQQTRPT